VAGTAAGTQFDQLLVQGAVALDGSINSSLINSFVPNPGTALQIVQGAGISGIFGTVTGATLPDGTSLRPEYFPTEVSLIPMLGVLPPANQTVLAAEQHAREAVRLLLAFPFYPNLHFAALCNCAEIIRAQAGSDPNLRRGAVELLCHAVEVVERPRLMASGSENVRAEFFARYSGAYDRLVEWLVEDHRLFDALVYAELCHNRTFLDHIRADGALLTHGLSAPDRQLADEERDLLAAYMAKARELERSRLNRSR
jgi:hypothetical protein